MNHVDLGKSGLMASQIALGCMRIGSMENREIEKHIQTALECGVNFFDHADVYGMGACEEKFGQALAGSPGLREKMILQTKCGIRRGSDGIWGYDFSKEYILECVDKALARLHTDYLDVLVLHRPDSVAWILRHPAQMQVIVGTTSPERLKDICTACNVTLGREDWYGIYKAAGNRLL